MKNTLELKKMYESDDFIKNNTYSGDDLGCSYLKNKVVFKVWAPLADKVNVKLFTKGSSMEEGDRLLGTYELIKGERCVYSLEIPNGQESGELDGVYYTYQIITGKDIVETADPYCKACGVNSERSMIVDLKDTDPEGWQNDKKVSTPLEEAIIYETHVKDFSYDPNSGIKDEYRGKYKAFTVDDSFYTAKDGEKFPTCLNYLKNLGITYVHLLPVADFGSIDESKEAGVGTDSFNWGYDPRLYNVPEGSYSTDPFDGKVRIREFKELVMSLHKAGIGVIMDVVYNHTYERDNPLHKIAPYYFHRIDENGEFSNGSGCGNETASEHIMYRNFMIQSILYWAEEYHIDGFRFDLMGLHDTETMNLIRQAVDEKIDGGKNIILYGEPWMADTTAMEDGYIPSVTANEKYLNGRIHIFSDSIRDAVKGSVFEADEPAYVNSDAKEAEKFVDDIKEAMTLKRRISYVSAHDNYTLYDKLLLSASHVTRNLKYKIVKAADNKEEKTRALEYYNQYKAKEKEGYEIFKTKGQIRKMSLMAAGIYFTSAGIPFMQAGEEFLRTKYGIGDSYNSPAYINALDWERAYENRDLIEEYKKLISLRKENHCLYHMDNDGMVQFISDEQTKKSAVIKFIVDKTLDVVYNPNETSVTIKKCNK